MTKLWPSLVALRLLVAVADVIPARKPNILYILLDDFGWAEVGYHRPKDWPEVQTQNMDALLKQGVELDRHYVFKYCSPTRSAIQTGRNPIHVNVLNIPDIIHNPKDPISGFPEIPRNMTGIAEHLVRAGYETHMYGKWHAGCAVKEQLPMMRGYQQSLAYLWGANDYWNSVTFKQCRIPLVDLWENDGPAYGKNNSLSCSQENQTGCTFEDQLFYERVIRALDDRNRSKPFYIFWAPHIAHTPQQVPDETLQKFNFIDEQHRRIYHAQVHWIDEKIGAVVQKLKADGTWNDTLIVLHADNGGPIYESGNAGSNNYPLKGGKRSNWEGGIRVNAMVSGGFVPQSVRGTKQEGLMTAWDWYATFAALAGVDPTDARSAAAGLPPVDSKNMWPLITGEASDSPRTEIAIGDTESTSPHIPSGTRVGGLIQNRYKIVIGDLESSGWTGPKFPNTTSHWNPSAPASWQTCGKDTQTGCLYDIFADPGEHVNLAHTRPETFSRMLARVKELQGGVFSPDRGKISVRALQKFCGIGVDKYKGFVGPYVDQIEASYPSAVFV